MSYNIPQREDFMIIEELSELSTRGKKKAYKKGALFAGKIEDCPEKYKHLLRQKGEIIIGVEMPYLIIRES